MCSTPKISSYSQEDTEVIQSAAQADASATKASASTRSGSSSALVSENIRTTNTGLDDEVVSSKKRLLGE